MALDEIERSIADRLGVLEKWKPTVDTKLDVLMHGQTQAAESRGELKAIVVSMAGQVARVERQMSEVSVTQSRMGDHVEAIISNGRSRKMWWSRVGASVAGFVISAVALLAVAKLFNWPIGGNHVEAASVVQRVK